MPKFVRKPIVVQAVQWFPGKRVAGVRTMVDSTAPGARIGYIDTLEGRMFVSPGDWIITGIKGERYPCKPDIFEQLYHPA